MKRALNQVWIILWKDLLIDLRRKENILGMVFFALMTLLMFQFALGRASDTRYRLTPRALAGMAGLGEARDTGEAAGGASVAGGASGSSETPDLAPAFSPASLATLKPLVGQVFSSQADFLRALNGLPGWRPNGAERIALLRAARRGFIQESAPGLLWVMFLMAGMLGLSKSFAQEREDACIDGLLLTPVSRGVIYLGKMASNALFLTVLLALVLPMFALMFQVPVRGVLLPLSLVLLAGVIGFSALGTLLGGITSTLRGKEVLLPLLLFPLMTPVLIVVVHLTGVILEGEPLAEQMGWIRLLAASDAVFLIVSYLVFDFVMES